LETILVSTRICQMRYIFCFVLFLGFYSAASAQNTPSTLLSQLESATDDSAKAFIYKSIYEQYQYVEPDTARHYLEAGLAYFKNVGYKRGEAIMEGLFGQWESIKGRQELAKVRFRYALKLYEEIHDQQGIASTNNNLGVAEARVGNYVPATKYFLTALHIFEKTKNKKGVVNTYLKLGTLNEVSNNLDKALDYFNKGLELSLTLPEKRNTAYLYNGIGVIYCRKERSDTGLVLFQRALELSRGPEMLETKVLVLMHMGNAYKDLEKFERSLQYYDSALALTSTENMPETYARILLNIAAVKGLTDHQGSLALLEQAYKVAEDIGNRDIRLETMEEMMVQYKRLGDYKAAFSILERSKNLQDSIFTLDKQTEIANLQSVYELEKSNQRVGQLEASEKTNTVQRNLIIFIACLLALTLIGLTATYRRTDKLNRELVKSQEELQRSSTIKDRIFSIIGHDLRGPIANIPMVIELYQDPRTSADERAYMLDLLTENSMASLETLDKLLHWGKSQIKGISILQKQFRASQNLQHQVSLIKGIANNKGITIKNNVSNDTVIFADEDHFNFVTRNLLSNAIKFSHKDSTVTLDADKYSRQGFTVFSVQDTGVGIDKEQKAKIFEAFSSSTLGTNNEGGTSIGLMLCKEFVTENGGDIWVESEPGKGATFYFSFKNS
jgi:signal transduction histidine kinase